MLDDNNLRMKKRNLYNKKEENGLQPCVGNCKPFFLLSLRLSAKIIS